MSMTYITPPATYSEWSVILGRLKEQVDDAAVLDAMQQGKIEWQTGVAERFTRKLVDVINFRMNMAIDKFQLEMKRSSGQERLIVQALIALRKELLFLSKAVCIPAIPEKNRIQYQQLIISQANSIQSSLEESAKQDRSGKLACIVKNTKVNMF